MDPYIHNINAGKTGATIPVQARLYSLKEGEKEVDETLCPISPFMRPMKMAGEMMLMLGLR